MTVTRTTSAASAKDISLWHRYDLVKCLALAYLAFPILIFLWNWMNLYVAVICCAAVVFSMFRIFQDYRCKTVLPEPQQITLPRFAPLLAIAVVWVAFSGIGGMGFQNWDFHFRNALFHDLVKYHWPVVYSSGRLMVYYFTYWMPAALAGKLWGWYAANMILFIWSVLGVMLAFRLLQRLLGNANPAVIGLFVMFSGLDILGLFLKGLFFKNVADSLRFPPALGEHIEWWVSGLQYSSNTTVLFWVFNQAIPIWIVVALILQEKSYKNMLGLAALLFPFSPFGFLGTLPLLAWKFWPA